VEWSGGGDAAEGELFGAVAAHEVLAALGGAEVAEGGALGLAALDRLQSGRALRLVAPMTHGSTMTAWP
jgi:hypothetical protein